MLKWIQVAIFSLFLTACGSNPQSYITGKSKPIVNIDASVNADIDVNAKSDYLAITNISQQARQIVYKLFWYDKLGVSQPPHTQTEREWQTLWLKAKEKQRIALVKPNQESENYRIYIK